MTKNKIEISSEKQKPSTKFQCKVCGHECPFPTSHYSDYKFHVESYSCPNCGVMIIADKMDHYKGIIEKWMVKI